MGSIVNRIGELRGRTLRVIQKVKWLAPTLARLTLGWVFVESGWGKIHNLPRVIEFFQSLGIPAAEFQAPFAAWMEFLCGAAILIGLFTRLSSVVIAIIMVVAIVTAKKVDILGPEDQPNDLAGKISALFGISEYLYISLCVYLGLEGAGPLGIDAWIAKWLDKKN